MFRMRAGLKQSVFSRATSGFAGLPPEVASDGSKQVSYASGPGITVSSTDEQN